MGGNILLSRTSPTKRVVIVKSRWTVERFPKLQPEKSTVESAIQREQNTWTFPIRMIIFGIGKKNSRFGDPWGRRMLSTCEKLFLNRQVKLVYEAVYIMYNTYPNLT